MAGRCCAHRAGSPGPGPSPRSLGRVRADQGHPGRFGRASFGRALLRRGAVRAPFGLGRSTGRFGLGRFGRGRYAVVRSPGWFALTGRPSHDRWSGRPDRPHPAGRARDGTSMRGHDGPDDREAEPAAPARARARRIGPVEALEDPARLFVGHARARCPAPRSRPGRPISSTRTVVDVPSGVCARTLASRLSITWRRRSLSAVTSTGRAAQKRTGHSGPTAVAVRTASDTSDTSSTCASSMGTPSSRRASVRGR